MTPIKAAAAVCILPLVGAAVAAQVRFTTVARGDMSGQQIARHVTVRTGTEWKALWKDHALTGTPPVVDFTRNMVVGIFLGTKPSVGYDVEIVGIQSEGADLVVEYVQRQPGRGTMAAQILIEPYHLVSVAKHPGPVRFVSVPVPRR